MSGSGSRHTLSDVNRVNGCRDCMVGCPLPRYISHRTKGGTVHERAVVFQDDLFFFFLFLGGVIFLLVCFVFLLKLRGRSQRSVNYMLTSVLFFQNKRNKQ